MSLRADILELCAAQDLDEREVTSGLATGIQQAAAEAWGPQRVFEAEYDVAAGRVRLFQILRASPEVGDPRNEISTEAPEAIGAEPGDEILIEVHYRDEDAEAARELASRLPGIPDLEELAAGLPCPESPAWLSQLWPHRRLAFLWGAPVRLPPLPESLDIISRWVATQEPSFEPGSSKGLSQLASLGDVARDAVAIMERFGAHGLAVFGAGLRTPAQALDERRMMNELLAQGVFDDRPGWWSPGWLPVFGGAGSSYCLDLDAALGGQPGQVVRWDEDGPERTIEAPSFAAWFGFLASSIDHGLLEWRGGISWTLPPSQCAWSRLRDAVMPGYPRAL